MTIFNGREEIRRRGDFGTRALIPFDVASAQVDGDQQNSRVEPPSAAPTPTPSATLRVEIVYDWYPKETGWTLVDKETGATLFVSPTYSVDTPMQSVVTDIPDVPLGRSYTLTITDVEHDGLCCLYGKGSARLAILEHDGSEKSTLWSSDGVFADEEVASVTLPHA